MAEHTEPERAEANTQTDETPEWQKPIDAWVQETCRAVSKELAQFVLERCDVIVLGSKDELPGPGVCIPPGNQKFSIVLRCWDDRALFHELAHAFLGHGGPPPSPALRQCCEDEAWPLAKQWLATWETRNYKGDLCNYHPLPPEQVPGDKKGE